MLFNKKVNQLMFSWIGWTVITLVLLKFFSVAMIVILGTIWTATTMALIVLISRRSSKLLRAKALLSNL